MKIKAKNLRPIAGKYYEISESKRIGCRLGIMKDALLKTDILQSEIKSMLNALTEKLFQERSIPINSDVICETTTFPEETESGEIKNVEALFFTIYFDIVKPKDIGKEYTPEEVATLIKEGKVTA